jgi:hypothetical protein
VAMRSRSSAGMILVNFLWNFGVDDVFGYRSEN